MVKQKKDPRKSAAYTLVDLSDLDEQLRKDLIEDANAGGGQYGIRVVEESVNGGARAPIYGVYDDGPDADRWEQAKKDLGIDGTEIDDADAYVSSGVGLEVTDPRREAAIREAAAQRVEAEAGRIRAGEAAAVREITGEEDDGEPQEPTEAEVRARAEPNINTVDTTLAPDAENEASNAEPTELEPTRPSRSTRNRSPR